MTGVRFDLVTHLFFVFLLFNTQLSTHCDFLSRVYYKNILFCFVKNIALNSNSAPHVDCKEHVTLRSGCSKLLEIKSCENLHDRLLLYIFDIHVVLLLIGSTFFSSFLSTYYESSNSKKIIL